MSTIATIPVHEIVERTFPRPPTRDEDRVAMAVGKAIDGSLARLGYEIRSGRRPTVTAARAYAATLLDEALEEAATEVPAAERTRLLGQVGDALQAYRRTPIYGLARPKTRVIVIDQRVGVYAQPDYWDGRQRFFELKSYRAVPMPPDVALQMRLYQLAFPAFESTLVCIDRHSRPVATTSVVVPPPTSEEADSALRLALELGVKFGQEKVLEYMEGPFVHYTLPPIVG